MNQVTANSAALRSYAHTQDTVAADADADARGSAIDVAGLSTTFGIIGADFLAAVTMVLRNRAERIDAVARGHRTLADGTRAADADYTRTDDAAAATIATARPSAPPVASAVGDVAV